MNQNTHPTGQFEIWNHKENNHTVGGFDSIPDAWAYVRAFLNTEDYEVRPQSPTHSIESETKRRGRKRIHPIGRKRHNLNIERDPDFDSCLASIMSKAQLNQTEAIKKAVEFYAQHMLGG